MDRIIELKLEECADAFLVSSPQFPHFHLSIETSEDDDLNKFVLPMLQDLIKREIKEDVTLHLIPMFGGGENLVPTLMPHVIARMAA